MAVENGEFAASIQAFDFRGLFIERFGWNNDTGEASIVVAGKTYTVQNTAEKSGFRILVCTPPQAG